MYSFSLLILTYFGFFAPTYLQLRVKKMFDWIVKTVADASGVTNQLKIAEWARLNRLTLSIWEPKTTNDVFMT
jgi:hypothetical protein